MQRRKPVAAELVEFLCDGCKRGHMRVVQGSKVIHSNPKQWLHKCSNCGAECHLSIAYPYLLYRGEDFMLAKHARFQTELAPMQAKSD